MSSKAKALGSGLEKRVVEWAQKRGLAAGRQPGSGVYAEYPNDVVVAGYLGECKVRSTLPSLAQMALWLMEAEQNAERHHMPGAFLTFNPKGSRHPVVMLSLDTFLDLLARDVPVK